MDNIIKSAGFDDWALLDQVNNSTTYFGYVSYGQSGNNPLCAILKVEKVGKVTTRKWANGSTRRNIRWDDRATQTYKFLQ